MKDKMSRVTIDRYFFKHPIALRLHNRHKPVIVLFIYV
jgi:AbrB family transcriptional regulator, transcriptional pleiotropic regulator of transition state genes